MTLSPYLTKYLAYELTREFASFDTRKFARTLLDAKVDLNPHQVEAALFAFRSPFSKGALLADEVGLGKTIEAGILLSQKWAERKRKILIILPSNLRKQWNQELLEKFYLPSKILEAKSFNAEVKSGVLSPFESTEEIVLCSYHFARNKTSEVVRVKWDLVVIDEAHRLRNVYRTDNKIGKAIKEAVAHAPKILLTATPLQNSLLELYGLISIIDDQVFGDLKSFKAQFSRPSDAEFGDLKARIKPICQRTLRRQVQEYIRYTKRIAITQEFIPTPEEHELYEEVSEYLRKPELYALPKSQRHLMTLILRKLLASSSFAISNTLFGLMKKLEKVLEEGMFVESGDNFLDEEYEEYEETKDEWSEEEEEEFSEEKIYDEKDRENIQKEIEALKKYYELAISIEHNAKGDALLMALQKGFSKLEELGGNEKAIIFTESTRTQSYLKDLLESQEEYAGKVTLFNGSNTDVKSKEIYKGFLEKYKGTENLTGSKTADMRSALVEHFQKNDKILIATEAAAEGINLQFCSLVLNYDLPWNPQRIEQRIGRCHRYGQQHDVVVINFLNKKNEADKRVYALLKEKFQLFDGVFGASDEVLGVIGSGVDFEKQIIKIYQECRTPEEITFAFEALQKNMEESITEEMGKTRQTLLEHFDEEVHEKLKGSQRESKNYLDKSQESLWDLARVFLSEYATFEEIEYSLNLHTAPAEGIPTGRYHMDYKKNQPHHFRLGCSLAEWIITKAKKQETEAREVVFDYSGTKKKISVLENLVGESGFLRLDRICLSALETEESLVFSGLTDEGETLEHDQCFRLLGLSANIQGEAQKEPAELAKLFTRQKKEILQDAEARNGAYFDEEVEKLEKWAEDLKKSLEIKLKEMETEIKARKTESRKIQKLERKVAEQRAIKELEKKRNELRSKLFASQDEVEERKEQLLDDIETRMSQNTEEQKLFCFRWKVV